MSDNTDHRQAQESPHPTHADLERHNQQLTEILRTANRLRLHLNLESLLQEIVQAAHRGLRFTTVVLNLIDHDSGQVRVCAHAGLDGDRQQALDGAVYPWEELAAQMQEQFRLGPCYFIPRGELDGDGASQGPVRAVASQRKLDDGKDAEHWYPDNTLLVPIELYPGRVMGVLSVGQSLDGHRSTPETLQALEIFANQAAAAIENAQRYQQMQQEIIQRKQAEQALLELIAQLERRVMEHTAELSRANDEHRREIQERREAEAALLQRNRELLSLQAAAAATASSLDLQFLLQTVTWEMASMLSVEGCTICEWHKDANTLSVIAEYGSADAQGEEPAAKAIDLADYPLRQRALVERYALQLTVSQPDIDPAERAYMQAANLKALLMLPMVFQDRAVGLVEITESQVEREFTDHEISLAQLLANQTASAVENARLYERAQWEIAERRRAEERIKASLDEKEVLLKEIHHRVKNNLQVISSLLSLQAKSIEEPSALEILKDSQNRVRSMALIHEKLYRSQDLARINFGGYIQNLVAHLVRSYRSNASSVSLRVNADSVYLSIDTAVPCGLIINELVSNALKHAFPNGREGEIRVELRPDTDRHLTLTIRDNGVGFPKDLDFRNTSSLGMQLVNTLTHQLEGAIELHNNEGTEFKITFPTPSGKGVTI